VSVSVCARARASSLPVLLLLPLLLPLPLAAADRVCASTTWAAVALTLLQVGRSGCVIDPLLYNHWHFTSYFVDNVGRAKCGPVLRVEEGDEVLALRVGGGVWML
jgi:hypothetical protein